MSKGVLFILYSVLYTLSVLFEVSLAFVGSAALAWRRVSVGGELGGPKLHSVPQPLHFS